MCSKILEKRFSDVPLYLIKLFYYTCMEYIYNLCSIGSKSSSDDTTYKKI